MNDYVTACNKLRERLKGLHDSESLSWEKIRALDNYSVSSTMLWKIAEKNYNPKGKTRVSLNLPPSRIRIAADVSEEQRETLNDMAVELNMTFSEMVQALADGKLGLKWND